MNIITKRNSTGSNTRMISGIIDFSDCVFCPHVFELGIAAAYLMSRRDNPIEYAKPFIQGYLSSNHLSKKSLDTLFYIITGRIAQSYINCELYVLLVIVCITEFLDVALQ